MSETRQWGGKHEGAGRPKQEGAVKRTYRGVAYFDAEWELIKAKAQAHDMSIREYIYWLAVRDTICDTRKKPDTGQ